MKLTPLKWQNRFEKIDDLGEGGNAHVYLVKDKRHGSELALKELIQKNVKEKQQRFINEITIANSITNSIPGFIPILTASKTEYWYIMPVALPITEYILHSTAVEIASGVIQLAETLEKLHELNFCHRDIKPDNIYFFDKRFCLGDLGLVNFPKSENDLTKSDRPLGAIFTIAPEMKRNPKKADGKKADVFSLAKTLWMLLTENTKGFDGVYDYADPVICLRNFKKCKKIHLVELEELLKDATDNNPNARPDMAEFKQRLLNWLVIIKDRYKSQASDWNFLQKLIFGNNAPETSKWTNTQKVIEILNYLGKTPAYNHMFLPDGGGLDFSMSAPAPEGGCVYLYDDIGFLFIVKPKALYYESIGDNYRWNYFLLEADKLQPLQAEGLLSYEYLVEDTPAHYVNASSAQYGVYDYDSGIRFPDGYKIVHRYFKGKFLIVMKEGPYNQINATYDGRHNCCSVEVFRNYIEQLKQAYNDIYDSFNQDEILKQEKEEHKEAIILHSLVFSVNPFKTVETEKSFDNSINERKKARNYIQNNYKFWDFKKHFTEDNGQVGKLKFYFAFQGGKYTSINGLIFESKVFLNRDGFFTDKAVNNNFEKFFVTDREAAIALKESLMNDIAILLQENGFIVSEQCDYEIAIIAEKCGRPTHLFTKQEIEKAMRQADDRRLNQLVIDEDGYAHVKVVTGYEYLYPVRIESWGAGNIYVGKYSSLAALNDAYFWALEGWLRYLRSGEIQFIDHDYTSRDEEAIIKEIQKFY